MTLYIPGEVYVNLVKMMDYRGVKMTSPIMNQDVLSQNLNHHKFVMFSGTRDAADIRGAITLVIVLMAPNSLAATKSPEFKKLFKQIKASVGNMGVMFISDQPLTTHVEKSLIQIRSALPKWQIEHYDYLKFMLEYPKHETIDQHIILTDEELQELHVRYKMERNSLPKIVQSDTMSVWLGLKPGMCIKVIRTSETAGLAISYRVCIKG